MTAKLWFTYIALFVIFTFIDQVGHGVFSVGDGGDINALVEYNVDELASGGGKLDLLRQGGTFFTTVMPKFVFWNYGFLTGQFQFLQYLFIAILGGLLIITFGQGMLGLLRRTFGG